MIKYNFKVIFIIVFALLILILPPLTFAASEDDNVPIPPTDPPSTVPLTPEGNLSLLDDLVVETNTDKQFITVQTKSGSIYYIIIDRASDENNVHFLNLVDEADLLEIMEETDQAIPPVASVPLTTEPELIIATESELDSVTPSTTEPNPPAPSTKTSVINPIPIIVFAAIAGIGLIVILIMVIKKKKTKKKNVAPYAFAFDQNEEEEDDEAEYNTDSL